MTVLCQWRTLGKKLAVSWMGPAGGKTPKWKMLQKIVGQGEKRWVFCKCTTHCRLYLHKWYLFIQDPAGIFDLIEVVGNGTYGQVYKVCWIWMYVLVFLFSRNALWVIEVLAWCVKIHVNACMLWRIPIDITHPVCESGNVSVRCRMINADVIRLNCVAVVLVQSLPKCASFSTMSGS